MLKKALLALMATTVLGCIGLLVLAGTPASQAPAVDAEPVTVDQPSPSSHSATPTPASGTSTAPAPTTVPAPVPAPPQQQVVIQPTPEVHSYDDDGHDDDGAEADDHDD